ncbi:ArdC-like ssDNA-binding domain-containing protein [Actinoplanes sp. NPDC049802]|uniref:ArdC-like ssDNA-binding domain-containing protein n=1 Tax=Actinoplanes sp. NPDC049802 TaxID=3154742 RepID=UPI003409F973
MVTTTGATDTDQDHDEFLQRIKTDFDARLAALASEPARWVQFIEQVAVFGAHYSLSNQLLLMMQAEDRGITPRFFLPFGNRAGTTGWKRHGRTVRKGEQAFKVWAPVRRRPTEDQARQWEAEGRTVRREPSGRPAVQVVGFGLMPTFELSQTDGEPFDVPTVSRRRRTMMSAAGLPQLLSGDDPTGAFDDLVTLIEAEGYAFDLAAPGSRYLGQANGVTVAGNVMRVRVRDDVSPAQQVKTTVHELAHIRCGHLTDHRPGEDLHRGRAETEAESIAHIVCAALGLDTAAYSDAYVLGWADGDLTLVAACATTVLAVAKRILTELAPQAPETTDGSALLAGDLA